MTQTAAIKWTSSWTVEGSKGNEYTVSRTADNVWGCTCPNWKLQEKGLSFRERKDCKHILRKKLEILQSDTKPTSEFCVHLNLRAVCPNPSCRLNTQPAPRQQHICSVSVTARGRKFRLTE